MASKSKSRRRVFRASCILAALIVAGSSFAWFTSSDEVTNRLSATADYGVTIAEDFTPPEKWLPGQKIEKNVSVVNTGNIDAFVRTWLEGEMNLLAEKRDTAKLTVAEGKFATSTPADALKTSMTYDKNGTTTITGLTDTKDKNLIDLGMTYSFTDGDNKYYLKELDTKMYANPNDPTAQKNNPAYFNEVMTVQAGGVLSYIKTGKTAGSGAKLFYYTPNNSYTFKSSKGLTYEVDGTKKYEVKLNDSSNSVFNSGNNNENDDIYVDGTTIYVAAETDAVKYLGEHIDSDNFYPAATGLFIFRRNEQKNHVPVGTEVTSGAETVYSSDYEFSGYYYVSSGAETGKLAIDDTDTPIADPDPFAVQGKYFALQYDKDNSQRSDYVLDETAYTVSIAETGAVTFAPTAALALFTAQQNIVKQTDLKWTYYDRTAFHNGKAYRTDGTSWYPVGSNTELDSNVQAENAIITALNTATTNRTTNMQPMYLVQDKADSGLKIDVQLADTIMGSGATYTGAALDGTNAETWTRKAGTVADKDTFYYNNDVEEGATTARLVDSVTLDGTVTQYDFLAFDFDLNIFMDSMQVTPTDSGVEGDANIKPWAAADNDNGEWNNDSNPTAANGAKGNTATDTEITFINWT